VRRRAGGPGIGLGRAAVVRARIDPASDLREQVVGELQQGLDARVGEAIVDEPALLLGRHEAALAQAPQVVRRIGLGEAGDLDDSAHRQGAVAQRLENREPRLVGEAAEQLGLEAVGLDAVHHKHSFRLWQFIVSSLNDMMNQFGDGINNEPNDRER